MTNDEREPGTSTLLNEGGRPSFTYSADWGWMGNVSDQGWRYYSCVRAFIFDKPAKWTLEITDETVAELLGRSIRSVARARQDCYAAGLVEEVAFTKRSVAVSGQVKREVRTFRTLRVAHEPPRGYVGAVNCFTEKDRIEEQHQAKLEQAREARQRPDSTNLSSRADQRERVTSGKPAGRSDSTDLSSLRTKMSEPVTDLSARTPSDQAKRTPQQVVKEVTTTNQPAGTARSAASGPASPGWLDGPQPQPQPQPPTPAAPGPGVRFLAELDVRHRPDQHAVRRLAPLVEALLAGDWSWDDLTRAVTAGMGTATNPPGVVISRITELERESRTGRPSRSEAAEKRRRADEQAAVENRQRAEARALAIANCPMCDNQGYAGTQLCGHDPSQDQTNAAGKARAWAALRSKPGGTATQPKTATQAS